MKRISVEFLGVLRQMILGIGLLVFTAELVEAQDVITLNSGKTIKGVILKYENGTLHAKTSPEAKLQAKMSAIKKIDFERPKNLSAVFKSDATSDADSGTGKSKKGTDISIEQMNNAPEDYVNKTLVFKSCKITHQLAQISLKGSYGLDVTSQGGTRFSPELYANEINFVVKKKMAEALFKDYEGEDEAWARCTLHCTLGKMEDFFIATVSKIHVYDKKGNLLNTYKQ